MTSSVGPVIVDCDVGVDDAVALALCMASDVDIIGITCVHGNTSLNNVILNTEMLLSVMKRKEVGTLQQTCQPQKNDKTLRYLQEKIKLHFTPGDSQKASPPIKRLL